MSQNTENTNITPQMSRGLSPSIEKLVDREEQLAKFRDVLDRISRQGPVSSNLFE